MSPVKRVPFPQLRNDFCSPSNSKYRKLGSFGLSPFKLEGDSLQYRFPGRSVEFIKRGRAGSSHGYNMIKFPRIRNEGLLRQTPFRGSIEPRLMMRAPLSPPRKKSKLTSSTLDSIRAIKGLSNERKC